MGATRLFSERRDLLRGIGDASISHLDSGPTSDTYGETARKALTARAGSTMSSVVRWLKEEKSFGITGVGILFNAFFLIIIAFVGSYIWHESRQQFWINNTPYGMVGIAEIQPGIYTPVYKEKK